MSTIPAGHFVSIIPGVVSAGGTALVMNGLFITESYRIPIGAVQSFASAPSVSAFFGPAAAETAAATRYFNGYTNSTRLPESLLFAQYPASAVSAWLQSGNVTALGLPAIQAMNGSLTLTVDGYAHVANSLNLSGATSYSAAAALILAGLSDPTECSFTATISSTTMTVSAVSTGTLSVGQTVTGAGVTTGSIITALGTGTGLTGTYILSASSTVGTGESMTAVATMPTVTFDSVSGGFLVTSGITGAASGMAYATGTLAASLLMTSATGATLSQGSAAMTPSAFMTSITLANQNWATFALMFDPDGGPSSNTQKMLFAAWTSAQNNRYMFACWDSDQSPVSSSSATSSMGYLIAANGYSGTCLITDPNNTQNLAAFVCGWAASLNFGALNGRTDLCYRNQSGVTATCSNLQAAENLESNGYNYYGAVATANQGFLFLYPGSVSGEFLWADTFIDQIWLNNGLQLALLELLTNVNSIPYNAAGNALVEAACMDPIQQAVNFGAIRAGVPLSNAQLAEINNVVGKDISGPLLNQGWYLDIQPSTSQTRSARQSPPITLFWVDGQSMQVLNVSSLEVQ